MLFIPAVGRPYICCKHAGSTYELHASSRVASVPLYNSAWSGNFGEDEVVKEVVGCTTSRWPTRFAGMEYDSVRIVSVPVLPCENTENCASKSSFACETGILIESQSPALLSVVALRPFPLNQALMAVTVSLEGESKAEAWKNVILVQEGPQRGRSSVPQLD